MVEPVPPIATVTPTTSTTKPPAAPVANAEATIAAMRPGMRSCYNRGLNKDPDMQGIIVIMIAVDGAGAVVDVSKVGGDGLASEVEDCIMNVARRGVFEAPGGSGSKVQVPITFKRLK